jgi:hypothetical protein
MSSSKGIAKKLIASLTNNNISFFSLLQQMASLLFISLPIRETKGIVCSLEI